MKADVGVARIDQGIYQLALGSLMYVGTGTRPDIIYAVGNGAKLCSDPTNCHWIAAKRISRYLN